MDNNLLHASISQQFPDLAVGIGNQFVEVTATEANLYQTAQKLKTDPDLEFDFLFCQTGVDLQNKLGVVYHLRSTRLGHTCVVKCFTDSRENALLPTVCDLWQSAQYFEREIYDLLGIRFTNHPNMKRVFLEDDFVGHPLRKDFIDPINIIHK
ncbi:MAG: NADH-quinone oxidoreductase subunit C [Breznakibacter sp.]